MRALRPHTWTAIVRRAYDIGLKAGTRQGYVSIERASEVCGIDTRTLRRVLDQRGVVVLLRRPNVGPRPCPRSIRREVELDAAREAVEWWCNTETSAAAAARHGKTRRCMWLRARRLGLTTPGTFTRLEPEQWDEIARSRGAR
jgi:hypothetical protein